MNEYIKREEVLRCFTPTEDASPFACGMSFGLRETIRRIPLADVVSRAEYDKMRRALALQYVRCYARYKAALAKARQDILHGSPAPPDGQPKGGGTPGDPTAQKAAALERLSRSHRARVVAVVEQAHSRIGLDVDSDTERRALRRAIWDSCLRRSDNPYGEFAAGLDFSKSDFYRRRRRFLDEIAERIEGNEE